LSDDAMPDIEKAKLYHVTGEIDRPERSGDGISVMFNPTSLKVTLANSLKENERNSNSRAAQYVDKSSSTFTVELIFDSSDQYERRGTVRKDVRKYSGVIANEFMKPEAVGDEDVEPKRCMFVWGTFLFVGIMESFDETLDFFSWEGTALRSTVSIKMTESRFQFESEDAKRARRDTPRLGRDNASPSQANTDAGQDEKNWRDTSMYNGVESPRSPTSGLAVPSASMSAGLSASVGASASFSAGASASLGTNISGAFTKNFFTSKIISTNSVKVSSPVIKVKASASLGFD
jgi:Contractile injection system tube protein